jgi:hypothetical protein
MQKKEFGSDNLLVLWYRFSEGKKWLGGWRNPEFSGENTKRLIMHVVSILIPIN